MNSNYRILHRRVGSKMINIAIPVCKEKKNQPVKPDEPDIEFGQISFKGIKIRTRTRMINKSEKSVSTDSMKPQKMRITLPSLKFMD